MTTSWNWWTVESRYCRMFFEEDIRSILAISIVGSQKQLQLNVFPHASKHMLCKKLIVWPVNWLTKTINFSGNILNKAHLHHNLCNIFCTISLGSISLCLDPPNKCVLQKEGIEWFWKFINIILQVLTLGAQSVSCRVPRTTIATQKQYHLAQVEHVKNLWTVFTMEAIVLVLVLTSIAKYMI